MTSQLSWNKWKLKWKILSLSTFSRVFSTECLHVDVALEMMRIVLESFISWWTRAKVIWTKRWIYKSSSSVSAYTQPQYSPCSKVDNKNLWTKWASLFCKSLQQVITLLRVATMSLTSLHMKYPIKIWNWWVKVVTKQTKGSWTNTWSEKHTRKESRWISKLLSHKSKRSKPQKRQRW